MLITTPEPPSTGNGWGEEAAGDQRAWLRGRLRTGRVRRIARTAADGVGAREWLEMVWERKPLGMSELGCAAAADGKWVGRIARTAWVPGSGWKWVGKRSRWRSASLAARAAADGKWLRRIARTAANGVGARDWLEMGNGGEEKPLVMSVDGKWVRRIARTADGVGAREWLEMGGEKKPLEISELGCADGCGRPGCQGVAGNGWGEEELLEISELGCADGCGRPECQGVAGNGCGEKKLLEISELGCADGCGREMAAENCADGCGRRGCKGVAGNG